MPDAQLTHAMGRYEWERIVRRVTMPKDQKLLALVLATYSDQDGSRVRPGNDILANVSGESERTVKRYLAALKKLGLLTVARRGGGHNGKGRTTEYQLSIPIDLLDRDDIDMLPPGERTASEANQVASHANPSTVDNSSETVDSPPVENSSGATQVASHADSRAEHEGPHVASQPEHERPNDQHEGPPRWPTTTHIRPPTKETKPVVTTAGESRPRARPPNDPPNPAPELVPARTEAA